MSGRTVTILLLLISAPSVALGGIIVEQSDTPPVSATASVSTMSVPVDSPTLVRNRSNTDGQMDQTSVSSNSVSWSLAMIDTAFFEIAVQCEGKISLTDSSMPELPDLDGLLKPPQGYLTLDC